MTIRHALALWVLVGAAPALAQGPSPLDPAAPRRGRAVTATGQTKPPGSVAGAPLQRPGSETEMVKAQKAAEARSKAWDARMRRTMGSICGGC